MPWRAGLWQEPVEANAVQTLNRSFALFCSVRACCGICEQGQRDTIWCSRFGLREEHVLTAEVRAELIKSHSSKQGASFPLRAERDRSSSKLGCSQPLHSGASDCEHEWIHDCYCCGHVGGIYSWNLNFLSTDEHEPNLVTYSLRYSTFPLALVYWPSFFSL